MKKLIVFLGVFLFSFSTIDMKNFAKWGMDYKKNFNVIDYYIENGKIKFDFPSITTKQVKETFKIIVIKKKNFDYELGLFSFDRNESIDFNKKLIFSSPKFDIWEITIPYEYRDLRFYCKYDDLLGVNHIDYSTDNFSVKPIKVYSPNKDTSTFNIIVDDGNSLYTDKERNTSDTLKYSYSIEDGKGNLIVWYSSISSFNFCLDENWTYVDNDDSSSEERKMPCVTLELPPIETGWGGVEVKTGYKHKPVDIKRNGNIYIPRLNW